MKEYYIVGKDEATGETFYVFDIFNVYQQEVGEDIGFNRGNAIKYISRYKRKTACGVYDLEKALDYLRLCSNNELEYIKYLWDPVRNPISKHYVYKKTMEFISNKCNMLNPSQKSIIILIIRGGSDYLEAMQKIYEQLLNEKQVYTEGE